MFAQVSSDRSLFASPLRWGITLQRYETSIEPTAPAPCGNYLDRAGADLLAREAVAKAGFRVRDYLRLVARHPFDFAGLYGRHVVNGLDLRDGEVYLTGPSRLRNGRAAFNFAMLFLAAWLALLHGRRAGSGAPGGAAAPRALPGRHGADLALLSLAAVGLPVAAIVPGATETRFFLPLHLLAYCTIAFRWDAQALRHSLLRRPVTVPLVFGAALVVFLAITLGTMASVHQACLDLVG